MRSSRDRNKNASDGWSEAFGRRAGSDLLSRGCSIIGPTSLTAVFGMGTGVTSSVLPPAKASGRGKPTRCVVDK